MKAGDRVICITRNWWIIHRGVFGFIQKNTPWKGKKSGGPKYNQIVVIKSTNGEPYYGICGFDGLYAKYNFMPLQEDFAEEVLTKAKEHQKEYDIPTINPATKEPIKI